MLRPHSWLLIAGLLAVAAPSAADGPVARIGTWTSPGWGFDTNTHWLEGPSGLVVIGTQFTPSAAATALDAAEKATGKKAVLAIVLHPNPDKFNGTETFQSRGVRVVTSRQVAEHIPAVHALRKKWFYRRYKPDYPSEAPNVEVFGDRTTTIYAGGLTLTAHVLGRATSAAHVVIEHAGHLFAGDLVSPGNHAWLELGHLAEWVEILKRLQSLKPTAVHAGRGKSGGAEALADQIAYLQYVSQTVGAVATGKPTEAALNALEKTIKAAYPRFDYDVFLSIGLPAVWANLAKER